MHELAICQALIVQVEGLAEERQAAWVSDVFIAVGRLSGVESALLQNAFPIAAAGTVANDATLHIEDLPVKVHCASCDVESEVEANRLLCSQCGDWRTKLVSGDELLLVSVELELDECTRPRKAGAAECLNVEGVYDV